MYHMKSIILHNEDISLPNCMYKALRIYNFNEFNDTSPNDNLNINEKVLKFLKISGKENMAELEGRQDLLLKKLDNLYDRITKISSICNTNNIVKSSPELKSVKSKISPTNEIVVNINSDNLPWYILILFKKMGSDCNIVWHIHSSVTNDKLPKLKSFTKYLEGYTIGTKVNLRLIFNNVSAETELKLSSLQHPIMGDVNVLRYLSLVYPQIFPSVNEFQQDSLLDLCHLLAKASEKAREHIVKKIFLNFSGWIYSNKFSIVDIAAYNVIKQWKNCPKYVPSNWYQNCEKLYK